MTLRKFALVAHQVMDASSATGLQKWAHRHHFDYAVRPGYIYVKSRAISSRTNDNHDTFSAEELKKGWRTFIGKPVFVNHNNQDVKRMRGVVVDAVLHEDKAPDGSDDTWIEVLMEVDARLFPKLAKALINGDIERTSMGVDVGWSECSYCGKVAKVPSDYCTHVQRNKGQRLRRKNAVTGAIEDVLIHEICHELSFFENSLLVEEPADPTAVLWGLDVRGILEEDQFADKLAKVASFKTAGKHKVSRGFKCGVPDGMGRPALALYRRLENKTATADDILLCAYGGDSGVGDQWAIEDDDRATDFAGWSDFPDGPAYDYAFVDDDMFVRQWVLNDCGPNPTDEEIWEELGDNLGEIAVVFVGTSDAKYVNDGWDAAIGQGTQVHLTEIRYDAGWGWVTLPTTKTVLASKMAAGGQPGGMDFRDYIHQRRQRMRDALPPGMADFTVDQLRNQLSIAKQLNQSDQAALIEAEIERRSKTASADIGGWHVYGPFPPGKRPGPVRYSKSWMVKVRTGDVVREFLFRSEEAAMAFVEEANNKPLNEVDQSRVLYASKTAAEALTDEQKARFKGTGVDKDDDGFYCKTHRIRSDSYPSIDEIPDSVIEFIESTGAKMKWPRRKKASIDIGLPTEMRFPARVETLRPPTCPVCESDAAWSSEGRCSNCGYLPAPKPFREPDTDIAGRVDQDGGWFNPELTQATPFKMPETSGPVQPSVPAKKGQRLDQGVFMAGESVAAAARRRLVADRALAEENSRLRAHIAQMNKRADTDNPAQPVPEPAAQAATPTSDPTTIDVTNKGGEVEVTAPTATQDVTKPGGVMPVTEPASVDVQAPVSGTQEVDPAASAQTAPNTSAETIGENAFGGDWVNPGKNTIGPSAARVQRAEMGRVAALVRDRIWASVRLARLRIQSGIAEVHDDLELGRQIEASQMSMDAIQAESSGLSKAMQARPVVRDRPAGRMASHRSPSLAGASQPMSMVGGLMNRGEDESLFE